MTQLSFPEHIFRAYDVRGIVGEDLNSDLMTLIGQAIGSEAIDQGESNLIVAADARLSSPEFSTAMIKGILSSGCDVTNIGIVPTPLMYFATHELEANSGLMITGSHNPKNYNGVKIVLKKECLAAQQIQKLQTRIHLNKMHTGTGRLNSYDLKNRYISRICADIKLQSSFKVVVDCGNAVASSVAPSLFEALGCHVIPLFCEPDGNFPNHHPDPSRAENLSSLIKLVKSEKADLGIAFDGDGDRVGLVSNKGNIIDADKMMITFIKDILPDNPGARVVFDVKSSRHLKSTIEENYGEAIMCKSGHSFVKQKMVETAAILGGEYSAHIFFKHRWYGFDDGLYTAARFLELMDKKSCNSEQLFQNCPANASTGELNIEVTDRIKFKIMDRLLQKANFPDGVINDLDGLRVDFQNGWGLIRASNTSPNLVLRFEADTTTILKTIIDAFKKEILRIEPSLQITF